ncbi:HAMP domain-containing histidine kinase [Candidatus Dojkabacteria bacterium]|nr:HAMP domain-containing histidine kinase [Candidatus Dojkabacteria bacterium]
MNKTAFKITLIIAVFCTTLLALLNFMVIERSRKAFIEVINRGAIRVERPIDEFDNRQGQFIFETSDRDADDTKRTRGPIETFTATFQKSLLLINLIGIIASVGIGFLAARIITEPLGQLEKGVKKLQENDYKFKLGKTGTHEFDKVIDEFNHLTTELERVETLRKDLISDTTHELKTPVTSLIGQLEGIKDGVLKPDKKRLQVLIDQVNRLDDLVERMQEYSRLRSKTAKLKIVSFLLKPFLRELIKPYSRELKGIKIILEINPDYFLKADKSLFERVIINLLENSLKYSRGNIITIKANENTITFEDNGIGIPANNMPYIFERFYRVEKSRNRKTGGLGLGLAIVKEIIEAHGWKIEAHNGKKSGLCYTIKF